jgi:hypothetical protein
MSTDPTDCLERMHGNAAIPMRVRYTLRPLRMSRRIVFGLCSRGGLDSLIGGAIRFRVEAQQTRSEYACVRTKPHRQNVSVCLGHSFVGCSLRISKVINRTSAGSVRRTCGPQIDPILSPPPGSIVSSGTLSECTRLATRGE